MGEEYQAGTIPSKCFRIVRLLPAEGIQDVPVTEERVAAFMNEAGSLKVAVEEQQVQTGVVAISLKHAVGVLVQLGSCPIKAFALRQQGV